jgi:dTDP-4-amino-4,6-dideoxygalactose transaminase
MKPPRRQAPFLVFGVPSTEEGDSAEAVDGLRAGWRGTGPKLARFEQAFRASTSGPRAVAVDSCTAALHLSMVGAGVQPGGEVITSALTLCATINAIIHAGATPVLVDVERTTMDLDPHVEDDAARSRTSALHGMGSDAWKRFSDEGYRLSVPEHRYYQARYGWVPESFPESTRIGRATLSLPSAPSLTGADLDRVADAVASTLSDPRSSV